MCFFFKPKTAFEIRIIDWSSDVCSSDLKSLFSIDLVLADAETGGNIKRLSSKLTNEDIDEYSFIESSGAFSPDSRKFAFSIFSRGKSRLMVVDVETGKELLVEAMGDISEFANIAWSPDGETVAFSGDRKSTRLNSSH